MPNVPLIITNSKEIVDFIRESEGYGGIVDKQPNAYVLVNVQVGFLDRFCEGIDSFITSKNIDLKKYGYRILHPRGGIAEEKGDLSSDFFI